MNGITLIFAIFALSFSLCSLGFALGVSNANPVISMSLVVGFSALVGVLFGTTTYKELNQDTYYLPCEVVATNDYCTYFGTVDSDFQEVYTVETGNHIWPDDVPYLLHMDSKGTKDTKDDEVLVVWRTD